MYISPWYEFENYKLKNLSGANKLTLYDPVILGGNIELVIIVSENGMWRVQHQVSFWTSRNF